MRWVAAAVEALVWAIVIAVAAPLLFWLGRGDRRVASELVVDPEVLDDDPGREVE